MPRRYRFIFLVIFTIFFIVTSSAITIYSLGYSIDFEDGTFDNTLNVRVETKPRGADIYAGSKKVAETPNDIVSPDNTLLPLSIKQKGYLTEKFRIWGEPKTNTSAIFSKVYLLPENYKELEDFNEDYDSVSILSDNYLLLQDDDDLYVQTYSFGGLQGESESIKTDHKIEIDNSRWEGLSENTFFWNRSKNLILYRDENQEWRVFDLKTLPIEPESIAKGYEQNIIIIDKSDKLWLLDLSETEKEIDFIDSNFEGLSFTSAPDSVWLWKNDSIYKLNREQINENLININLAEYRYIKKDEFEANSINNNFEGDRFVAKAVFQGMSFKCGNKLYYIPSYNKDIIQILGNNVAVISVFDNTVYWLDENKQVHSHNLDLGDRDVFDRIELTGDDFKEFAIVYSEEWLRIMIYSQTEVFSIWHDKDTLNDVVTTYQPNFWITQATCRSAIYEKSQFCIKSNALILYQNKAIF